MSRKARLTKKDLDLLAKAAIECPGETAATVLARYSELEGRTISLSTVEKKLAEWRRNETISPAKATLRPEERPLGLEAPWSLGVSAQPEHGITPEATGDLLAVWNYCLAIGHVFTICEARWVARLRNAITDGNSRIGQLFAFAYEYGVRERICKILNKQMDTHDLDGELGINDRERFVYRALGLIPKLTIPFHPREPRGTDKASEFLGRLVPAESAATYIAFDNIPTGALREDTSRELQKIYSFTGNLPATQDRIYAALLLFLSKGSKWNALSANDYLEILSALKKWIMQEVSLKNLLEYTMLDHKDGLKPADILAPNLLEIVGYEVDTQTTQKEAENERTYTAKK